MSMPLHDDSGKYRDAPVGIGQAAPVYELPEGRTQGVYELETSHR